MTDLERLQARSANPYDLGSMWRFEQSRRRKRKPRHSTELDWSAWRELATPIAPMGDVSQGGRGAAYNRPVWVRSPPSPTDRG